MKKGRYLGEKAREDIAVAYRRDTLYMLLRTLALEAEEAYSESQHFLSGEDLFYLVAEELDTFLEMDDPHETEAMSESDATWVRVKQQLRADSVMVEQELNAAASLVTLATRECLRRGDMWRYWDVCQALADGTLSHDPECWEKLQPMITSLWQREEWSRQYAVWWQHYTEADTWLSDELASRLLVINREESKAPDVPHKTELVEALRQFFWDDAVRAEQFLLAIYNKSDLEVVSEIMHLKRSKSINLNRRLKLLHEALSDERHQLYRATYGNFAAQLRD